MPDELIPVSEQVVVRLGELLRGITTDAGEYANDVVVERNVVSGNPKGQRGATLQIVLLEEVPADDLENTPLTLSGYRMQVGIFFFPLNASGTGKQDEQAMGRLIARAHADIRKRIETDRNLGGLAMIDAIGTPAASDLLGDLPVNRIPVEIVFWTKYGDPYRSYLE